MSHRSPSEHTLASLAPSRTALLLAVAVAVAVAIASSACLGRSPEPRLFTLGATPRAADAPLDSELAVLVGPVRFPRYLERPQLVRRLEGGELDLDEFNRWAGSFEENVVRALSLDVANRLRSDRVVAYPSDPPFALDYRVRIHFDELVVGPDDVLRMRARWSIRHGQNDAPPRIGRTDLDRPVSGRSIEAVVRAHEEAVAALGKALVREIEGMVGVVGFEPTTLNPQSSGSTTELHPDAGSPRATHHPRTHGPGTRAGGFASQRSLAAANDAI